MVERGISHPDQQALDVMTHMERLKAPSAFQNFSEWKRELLGAFRIGYVVGILLSQDDPRNARVYIDSGWRRKTANEEGIVLMGIETSTWKVLKHDIQVGDLVETNWTYEKLKKIASQDELQRRGILFQRAEFSWKRVIGAI